MNRKELKQFVLSKLNVQIEQLQNQITDLTQDAQNDAKSSAGDKHETGLAMMHIEQEKRSHKLSQLIQLKQLAAQLPEEKLHNKIAIGSIVRTNQAIFYLSIPLPQFTYQNKTVYCISAQAPLTQLLLNQHVGSKITFNKITYEILEIF